jgi:hypothetical protein
LPRRAYTGSPTPWVVGASVLFLFMAATISSTASATGAQIKLRANTALGGFIKDQALARVLGETLFRDTVDVMSDPSVAHAAASPATAPAAVDPSRDNSAAGQVARTVLAHQSLDKYLWLIRQAYADTLWKGGDRVRIEQHFPLIWRTSIMLYEATLNASPNRVRVCTPAADGDSFDCRDEVERAKIIPIPAQAPILQLHNQPNIG